MNISKTLGATLVGLACLALPSIAQAQELTLRVEPGVAFPVGNPQHQRFDVGGALALKPEFSFGPGNVVSVGPSAQVIALPSTIDGTDTGTAWQFGGFLRLKRTHGPNNKGTGFGATSPWLDGDLGYVRTGDLNRIGWSVALGASVPTGADRQVWIGPFVRFNDIHQDGGQIGLNTNDAKTIIAGFSFEIGGPAKTVVVATEPTPEPTTPDAVPVVQPPRPAVSQAVSQQMHLSETIQFAWDSAVLDAKAQTLLNIVRGKLADADTIQSVVVSGHASSEGQVHHNDVLAQKRAKAVADFLVAHGVDKTKITAIGFGSRVPVATNKTEAGRVANRRAVCVVDFTITVVSSSTTASEVR
jgi:outer membrane protein OmpA-like peptidoglycan-associated protein